MVIDSDMRFMLELSARRGALGTPDSPDVDNFPNCGDFLFRLAMAP